MGGVCRAIDQQNRPAPNVVENATERVAMATTPRETLLQPAVCNQAVPRQPKGKRRAPSRDRASRAPRSPRSKSRSPCRISIEPRARDTWLGTVAARATARGERDSALEAESFSAAASLYASVSAGGGAGGGASVLQPSVPSDPLQRSGSVCAPEQTTRAPSVQRAVSPGAAVVLDGTTGLLARPRTPGGGRGRTLSPAGTARGRTSPGALKQEYEEHEAGKREFCELQLRHQTSVCADSKRVWFADVSQWKRLPGNRLVAVSPVYATLHQVPDAALNSTHGESLAVEFGYSVASPLSEVMTDRRWWKLQLQQDFKPCVMGVVLYKLRAWVHEASDPLFIAARSGNAAAVSEVCMSEPQRCCRVDFGGRAAVHIACQYGRLDALRALVELCAATAGTPSAADGRPECRGRSEILNLRTLGGETPLMVAAQHGKSVVLEWLLAATVDVRDTPLGEKPKPLCDVNERAWTEVSPSVIAESAAVLNSEESVSLGSRNMTQFPQQLSSTKMVRCAQRAFGSFAGSGPRFAGTERGMLTLAACAWERRGGQTALIRAAANGQAQTVQRLLVHGARVAVADVGGFNALHAAIVACIGLATAPAPEPIEDEDFANGERIREVEAELTVRVEVVRELLRADLLSPSIDDRRSVGSRIVGSKPDDGSPDDDVVMDWQHTPLSLLVQLACEVAPSSEIGTQLVDTLLGVLVIEGNPDGALIEEPSGESGRTPLLWAVHAGNVPMVRQLLSHGARAGSLDSDGRNAVHTLVAAVVAGHVSSKLTLELMTLLVDTHRVSVSNTDSAGWTPLLIAVAGPSKDPQEKSSSGSFGVGEAGAEIMEWLLARGAGESVPVELADGRTAAELCMQNGDKEGAARLVQEQRYFEKARWRLLAAKKARAQRERVTDTNAREAMENAAARDYAERVANGSEETATSAARRDIYGAASEWWGKKQETMTEREASIAAARVQEKEMEDEHMEQALENIHTKLGELKSAEAWDRHHSESWISPALPVPGAAGVSGLVSQNRVLVDGHTGGATDVDGLSVDDQGRWTEGASVVQSVNTDTLAATLGDMGFLQSSNSAKKKAREAKTARVEAEAAVKQAQQKGQVFSTETINGKVSDVGGTMTFQHVGLKAFQGRNFHLTESLTTLNILSCPEMEDIPGVVCLMPQLTELNVSNNSLTSLPSGLGKLAKLDSLRAANNLLTALPNALAFCLEMRTLDMRQNGISELPEDLTALQWLETLDLTDNCFGTLPLPVLELGSLTHLFIGSNSLARLPDLSPLEMLASIDVSGNGLKELNPSVWELPRLRELRAADNSIEEVRVEEGASFLRLRLRVLRLDNNNLTGLPAQLGSLTNLCEVNLEGNLLAGAMTDDDPVVNRMRVTCEKHSGELLV